MSTAGHAGGTRAPPPQKETRRLWWRGRACAIRALEDLNAHRAAANTSEDATPATPPTAKPVV
eukprot:1531431-Pleurochrysis_carterae.AAC.1